MDPTDRARVVAGKGIVGNANQGGKRQVTIVSDRHWKIGHVAARRDARIRACAAPTCWCRMSISPTRAARF